jgi:hypothetical protein
LQESGYAGAVGKWGSSGEGGGGGSEEAFRGRAAVEYDHGYDAEVFYLGLALDPRYVEGFVEGCLERIGEERTVKRLRREGEAVRLRAQNGGHEDIVVRGDEVRVQGRVIWVFHPPGG